jgi:hypothetical protein
MAKKKCGCKKTKKKASSKAWNGGSLDFEGLYGNSQKGKKKAGSW